MNTLYLEDETLIALDGEDTLLELGFSDLHCARTLDQAYAIADRVDLDLAVLDVNLGRGQNSLTLARQLIGRNIAVVFVSGYNAAEFPADLRRIPIATKPFNPADLASAIDKAMPK